MSGKLSEDLFAAMQTIVEEQVKSLSFNKTIRCCITKADKASEGEYTVNDGVNTFTAYSDNTSYKENNYVYVLIPNGDYTQQKTIVGKYVTTDSATYTYVKPSETYVDITGNLITVDEENIFELTANGDTSEVVIQRFDISEKAYDRIVIRGSFQSWLSKYRLIGGNYGLRLDIVEEIPTTTTSTQKKYYSFKLDSKDMWGDAYNFETYYDQEAIFDISNLKYMKQMRLVFYQDKNFKNNVCTIAPIATSNLFMKMPYVSLGYDLNNFTEDKVLLYSFDSDTYSESLTQKMKDELGITDDSFSDATRQGLIDDYNSKTLKMRWVRLNDAEDKDSSQEDLISVVDTKTMPKNAIIHWYKYNLQQGISDELAGAFWEEIIDNQNSFDLVDFIPDVTKQVERIKVIIENPSKEYLSSLAEEDEAAISAWRTAAGGDYISADEQKAALEEYEAIVNSYLSQAVLYESEIYELTNESYVPDYASVDLINGLKLKVDEDGYKGTYFIYNKSGKISSQNEYTKSRYITADYSSLVSGNKDLDTAEKITWLIPISNTMIQYPSDGVEYDEAVDEFQKSADGNYFEITRYGIAPTTEPGSSEADSTQLTFRIKEFYSQTATNNTIICRITKNNRLYEAAAELKFGTSGTNGTDYTFVLQFTNNEPALPLPTDQNVTAIVEPIIFDAENNIVTENFTNFQYSWYSEGLGGISLGTPDDGSNEQPIILSGSTIDDCRYYILKCSATGNVTLATTVRQVTMTAYLPIPVKEKGYDFLTVDGADSIQYNTSGTSPQYYNNPYTLYNMITQPDQTIIQQKIGALWRMSFGNDCSEGGDTEDGYQFYPQVSEDGKLTVPSLYLTGCGKQISVDAYVNGVCIWSQPIRIYIDAYGSALMNSWDGNLTIDEENGTIMSAMIGAGIKNADNSFSAVLMGDVGKAGIENASGALSSYYNGIGVYGFNEGIRSFGLNVNGKAFFGKPGKGQILIDGNSSELQSANYKISGEGLHLQLDSGVISSKGPKDSTTQKQASVTIDPTVDQVNSAKPYFEVTSQNGTDLISFGPKTQKLKSNNFNGSAKQGTIFDLSTGYLQAFGPNGSYVRLSGSNESTDFFVIHDGNANKDIFKASRSSTIQTETETTEVVELSENCKTADEKIAYLNSLFTPGYRVDAAVVDTTGKLHTIQRGIDYIPTRYETSEGILQSSMYRMILTVAQHSKYLYKGESASYPVTKNVTEETKAEGDITSSECSSWVTHTIMRVYEIVVPLRQMATIYNVPVNATVLRNRLSLIPDNVLASAFINNRERFEYTVLSEENYYEIQSTITYKVRHLSSYIQNSHYFLQSSNYDGKTNGCRLDISKGTFTAFGDNGSCVKLNGNGSDSSGFFSVYDRNGVDSNGDSGEEGKGKYIFFAGGSSMGVHTTPGGDIINTFENGKFYLQSSNFLKQNGDQQGQGCKLDLSKGTFLTYDNNGAYVLIDGAATSALLKVACTNSNGENRTVLLIDNKGLSDDQKYYLQTVDYSTDNHTGMKIDLNKGKITAYSFEIKAYKKNSNEENWIKIKSDDDDPLEIRGVDSDGTINKFSVGYDGKVTASYIEAKEGGKIGPFTISSTALYTGGKTLGGSGVYLGSDGLSVANGKFKVNSDGDIWSSGDLHIDGAATVRGTIKQGGSAGTTSYEFGEDSAKIGPWTINADSISTDEGSEIGSSGTIKFCNDNSSLELVDSSFSVNVGSKQSATSKIYLSGDSGQFDVDTYAYLHIYGGSSDAVYLRSSNNTSLTLSDGITIKSGNYSITVDSGGITLKSGSYSFGLSPDGYLTVNGSQAFSKNSYTAIIDTPWSTKIGALTFSNGIITNWDDHYADE